MSKEIDQKLSEIAKTPIWLMVKQQMERILDRYYSWDTEDEKLASAKEVRKFVETLTNSIEGAEEALKF